MAVVITAGGRIARAEFVFTGLPDGYTIADGYDFESGGGYLVKALLKVGGRTLMETVLEAVRSAERANRTVVVGAAELHYFIRGPQESLVPEQTEAHENLIAGLQAVADYPRVLYLTSDLPFVTADAICHFVDACPSDAQLCYGIVRREVFDARFPRSPSTYARLKDGEFVAGCAVMIKPAPLLERADWIRKVARRRKSLWRLALLAGFPVLWRYAFHRLRVTDLERRAERLLGMRCRAVPCEPELAYDIDTPQDYLYAWRLVHGRAG